jgi:hypothetical protein
MAPPSSNPAIQGSFNETLEALKPTASVAAADTSEASTQPVSVSVSMDSLGAIVLSEADAADELLDVPSRLEVLGDDVAVRTDDVNAQTDEINGQTDDADDPVDDAVVKKLAKSDVSSEEQELMAETEAPEVVFRRVSWACGLSWRSAEDQKPVNLQRARFVLAIMYVGERTSRDLA